MSALEQAIALAAQKHAGQKDKAGQPYILHLLRVMMQMETEEERIVAVLHDILEDTNTAVSELYDHGFDTTIVFAVIALTKRKDEDYYEFIERVSKNDLARRVKLADLKDNMNWDRIQNPSEKDMERMQKYQKAYYMLLAAG
jgi:Guanosine polyphosphate pyrophosphohydrolases/synthetases